MMPLNILFSVGILTTIRFLGPLTHILTAWVLSDYSSSILDLNSRDSFRE